MQSRDENFFRLKEAQNKHFDDKFTDTCSIHAARIYQDFRLSIVIRLQAIAEL